MSKRNPQWNLTDIMTRIVDNDEIDDESRQFQLRFLARLNKVPAEKLDEVMDEILARIKKLVPFRVIAGGKK